MHSVKRQTVLVILMAFVLILILSALYSQAEPPFPLYISFVVVSLIVANLLALLAVQLNRLESEAVTDPLTGAFNRRYFEKRVHQEIKRAERTQRPLSLLFIDIDNFKAYNDKHGHAAGDAAVKLVVERASTCIREMDIVSRHGGEEFIVLLPEVGIDAAAGVSERIRESMASRTTDTPGDEIEAFDVTIGVASLRPRESSVSFLKRADQAMYQGKLRGKNQSFLDPHDAKGRILVVDEGADIREICARVLLREGFVVDTAATGEAVSKMADQTSYDLLITDMGAPGAKGLDILKALRGSSPQVPAISISSTVDDEARKALEAMGHVEFLHKPFESLDLIDSVKDLISRPDSAPEEASRP